MVIQVRDIVEDPSANHEIFGIMKDFRKGGLHPDMYQEFIDTFKLLPHISKRTKNDYNIFDKFNLGSITKEDANVILKELKKRAEDKNRMCWHPLASSLTCDLDSLGNVKITRAHSIQNNGILNKISDNGLVTDFLPQNGKTIHKNHASVFLGFCNKHDAIFEPVELKPYIQSEEQNFLFAYRAFTLGYHKKRETSQNTISQWEKDLVNNKEIFDKAIISGEFSVIETEVFEFPSNYPLASSNTFNLEFDFEGNPLTHSDERMENIFATLIPAEKNTYFLLSYFREDKSIYGRLGSQIRARNNFRSDISMLIMQGENTFFNPTYYNTFIKKFESDIFRFVTQAATNTVSYTDNATIIRSNTPHNILDNPYNIELFGY